MEYFFSSEISMHVMNNDAILKWIVWSATVALIGLVYVFAHTKLVMIPGFALGGMYVLVICKSELIGAKPWLPGKFRYALKYYLNRRGSLGIALVFLIAWPVFGGSIFFFFCNLHELSIAPPVPLGEMQVEQGVIVWIERGGKGTSWIVLKKNDGQKLKLRYKGSLSRYHEIETAIKYRQPAKVWISRRIDGGFLQVKSERVTVEQVEINGEIIVHYNYDRVKRLDENNRAWPPLSLNFLILSFFFLCADYYRYRRGLNLYFLEKAQGVNLIRKTW